MTTTIPALPTPPQSTDPANFAPRADAFLGALPAWGAAANAQAAENNALNASVAAAAATAAAAAASARNASDLATAAAAAGPWSAATTYTAGALAWSPINGLIYRRLSAGKSSADPSADKANWVDVSNLPTGSAPDQAPTVQQLGALAFLDAVGITSVQRHAPSSRPGDVWREYVSDTSTVIKFHGLDGVIRTRTESWT